MAPTGCAQYYVGEKGVVKSFNFEGLQYFVDQDIRICIKPERGHCKIQFEAEANQFMISVKLFSGGIFFSKTKGYNFQSRSEDKSYKYRYLNQNQLSGSGSKHCATDFILIPNAEGTQR